MCSQYSKHGNCDLYCTKLKTTADGLATTYQTLLKTPLTLSDVNGWGP